MDSRVKPEATSHGGGFRGRVAWILGLQFMVVVLTCMMGIYNVAPLLAVIVLLVASSMVAWLAIQNEWLAVRKLARLIERWEAEPPDAQSLQQDGQRAPNDADVAALSSGMHRFAARIRAYHQRERDFTRDASHELRSPLTVIKMSTAMLADEDSLSESGARSVRRIRRATNELEALVEALLVLAREPVAQELAEHFVVNDVLQHQLEFARELMAGRSIDLQLEERAHFALQGSAQVFSVLCWQLIRNACQQVERGQVRIVIAPGMVSVSNRADPDVIGDSSSPARVRVADRHGFELAIARRISERFDWPLELQTRPGQENIASLRFAHPLPVEVTG